MTQTKTVQRSCAAGDLEAMLKETVSAYAESIAAEEILPGLRQRIVEEFGIVPQRHVVTMADHEPCVLDETVHKSFDAVVHMVAADVPVLLTGPAGSGKNVLVSQVARALGLEFHFMNSVTDEFKFAGFIDAGGHYHETEFYRAFKHGGVFFLDELDASAPEVLVCLNMAISNRMFAFPHETVPAHPDFRVVAAGNTLGTGADIAYTGRLQLDAASLNRFIVIPVDYDPDIDLISARGDVELVEFAHQYRQSARACGVASVCSYRNLAMIKVAAEAMPLAQALACALTKDLDRDDITVMLEHGDFDSRNRYVQAFRQVEPIS